jgi:LacI family sucrose operon transcriptional repressor
MSRVPTIKDVAAEAGVTVTTVSRYLNKRGYMSEKTGAKIERVMKELGYVPNEIARSLYRRKSNILGVIIPTAVHPFFGELISSIESRAYESGYKILLCESRLDRTKEKDYVEMLTSHKVDGIVMASHTLEVDEYRNLGMPVVTIDRKIGDDIPYVTSDNYEGGSLAARFLLARGCKTIAYFGGNLGLDLLPNKRCEAFLAEVEKAGAKPILIQTDIDVFDFSQYSVLVDSLFREHPDADGVFASDLKAAHIIQACGRLGRRVPEDLKLVGYDDILFASLMSPRLTTIRQPIEEMGRRAVELLVAQIAGQAVPMANVLPVSLVERGSA